MTSAQPKARPLDLRLLFESSPGSCLVLTPDLSLYWLALNETP